MAGNSPARGSIKKDAKLTLKEKRMQKKQAAEPFIKPRKGH